MSGEDDSDGGIERYRSSRPTSSGERRPTVDSRSASSTLVDTVSGSLSRRHAVTTETSSARATLVGVPTVDVGEFTYSHQDDAGRHPVALFDVENTGESPLRWHASRTQFVGTDDYTYQPARLSLDPETLGPGCHTRQVEIQPGRRARVVTVVEALPAGVEIAEVVHSVPVQRGLGGRERLVFSLG